MGHGSESSEESLYCYYLYLYHILMFLIGLFFCQARYTPDRAFSTEKVCDDYDDYDIYISISEVYETAEIHLHNHS